MSSVFFPCFLENDHLKVERIVGLTFFKARKDLEGFNTAFFNAFCSMDCLQLPCIHVDSLRSRRSDVVGERENGRPRGRHARGEGAPARKAPGNRFNSHTVSADISNWLRGSRGKN